jgi:hypothetical protein
MIIVFGPTWVKHEPSGGARYDEKGPGGRIHDRRGRPDRPQRKTGTR